jgi:hypothetical protein
MSEKNILVRQKSKTYSIAIMIVTGLDESKDYDNWFEQNMQRVKIGEENVNAATKLATDIGVIN